jgi:hypothetical protein
MPDSFTLWRRETDAAASREDAAASLEEAAKIVRESGGLTSAGQQVYLYAREGTALDRIEAIDAWAAEHHVTAASHPVVGYCARLPLGSVSVWAVALPVRELAGVAA